MGGVVTVTAGAGERLLRRADAAAACFETGVWVDWVLKQVGASGRRRAARAGLGRVTATQDPSLHTPAENPFLMSPRYRALASGRKPANQTRVSLNCNQVGTVL
jgi:hypothetical protein